MNRGFTLIEVLLALAVIAISLTALLKSNSQTVVYTDRIKEKSIRHWIMMQGVTMIQLNLIPVKKGEEITKVTTMFGKKWYWRVKILPTEIKRMDKIYITSSPNQLGPFNEELTAFRLSS